MCGKQYQCGIDFESKSASGNQKRLPRAREFSSALEGGTGHRKEHEYRREHSTLHTVCTPDQNGESVMRDGHGRYCLDVTFRGGMHTGFEIGQMCTG